MSLAPPAVNVVETIERGTFLEQRLACGHIATYAKGAKVTPVRRRCWECLNLPRPKKAQNSFDRGEEV